MNKQTLVLTGLALWPHYKAPENEAADQDSLRSSQEVAERVHCWAFYPLLLPFLGQWCAWRLGFAGSSTGGPCSKLAVRAVDDDDAAADGGRCQSDD